MIKTTEEHEDGTTITLTDGIVRCTLQGSRKLWSYEVSGDGITENKAIKDLLDNLAILKEKLQEISL